MKTKVPIAKKQSKTLEKHGDKRIDDYFWMNQRDSKDVISYLEAENKFNEEMTASTKTFQEDLFQEMKVRIKEDDSSVPYKYNGYWYITRFEEGKDYPIYTRKKDTLNANEDILFDCNIMAEGHEYFQFGGISISPNNRYAAFSIDTVSRRLYTLQIKDLKTGNIFEEKIINTTGGSVWANDNSSLFYTLKDESTLRSNQVFRHQLGTDSEKDARIFYEEDETFYCFISKTKSKKYLIIGSESTTTSEYQFLESNTPNKQFKIFQKRTRGLEYSIDHYEKHFYIMTNADKATNFKLQKTQEDKTEKAYWEDVISHRENTLLEGIDIFKDYLVLSERTNGLNEIRIKTWDGRTDYYLPFDNETYTAQTFSNPEFDTSILRYSYNSLTTPNSVIDFDMETKKKIVKKETEVLGGKFDKNNYTSERIWAISEDNVKVPISLVYRKGLKKDGKTPLLLYGYGSYGHTIDPYFSSVRLSLLDRGFIFAIAHVRGSEYLGRSWYENGKLLHKKNTFIDFICCAKHLSKEKYTSSEHCYAMGGSAGGLLMGAVMNMSPESFNGVIASVPFVDVVTTMLDDSIPLTTGEYDEWGNPNDKIFYDYMKSYSPYDNISAQNYPNILVTTGYHDSQVQYWEPAKWVAKLRSLKTDNNLLLFHTNMKAGHSGASGRFEALKEVAEEYSFILNLEDILE